VCVSRLVTVMRRRWSGEGVAKFLTWLERRHGRLEDLIRPAPVVTADTLDREHLMEVSAGLERKWV
jgi:hypothetical protein